MFKKMKTWLTTTKKERELSRLVNEKLMHIGGLESELDRQKQYNTTLNNRLNELDRSVRESHMLRTEKLDAIQLSTKSHESLNADRSEAIVKLLGYVDQSSRQASDSISNLASAVIEDRKNISESLGKIAEQIVAQIGSASPWIGSLGVNVDVNAGDLLVIRSGGVLQTYIGQVTIWIGIGDSYQIITAA